jgi:hypothetical protein
MGYTHYYYRTESLDENIFKEASFDCKEICNLIKDEKNINIQYDFDNNKKPVFTKSQVRFNGIDEDGHETFHISPIYKSSYKQTNNQGLLFQFCKTARKPYDFNVMCCLIIYKHHFGNEFLVYSDGEMKDWKPAIDFCQKYLNYGQDFQLDND